MRVLLILACLVAAASARSFFGLKWGKKAKKEAVAAKPEKMPKIDCSLDGFKLKIKTAESKCKAPKPKRSWWNPKKLFSGPRWTDQPAVCMLGLDDVVYGRGRFIYVSFSKLRAYFVSLNLETPYDQCVEKKLSDFKGPLSFIHRVFFRSGDLPKLEEKFDELKTCVQETTKKICNGEESAEEKPAEDTAEEETVDEEVAEEEVAEEEAAAEKAAEEEAAEEEAAEEEAAEEEAAEEETEEEATEEETTQEEETVEEEGSCSGDGSVSDDGSGDLVVEVDSGDDSAGDLVVDVGNGEKQVDTETETGAGEGEEEEEEEPTGELVVDVGNGEEEVDTETEMEAEEEEEPTGEFVVDVGDGEEEVDTETEVEAEEEEEPTGELVVDVGDGEEEVDAETEMEAEEEVEEEEEPAGQLVVDVGNGEEEVDAETEMEAEEEVEEEEVAETEGEKEVVVTLEKETKKSPKTVVIVGMNTEQGNNLQAIGANPAFPCSNGKCPAQSDIPVQISEQCSDLYPEYETLRPKVSELSWSQDGFTGVPMYYANLADSDSPYYHKEIAEAAKVSSNIASSVWIVEFDMDCSALEASQGWFQFKPVIVTPNGEKFYEPSISHSGNKFCGGCDETAADPTMIYDTSYAKCGAINIHPTWGSEECTVVQSETQEEEPKVEEPKVEEPKVEEPKEEEPKDEEPKVEEVKEDPYLSADPSTISYIGKAYTQRLRDEAGITKVQGVLCKYLASEDCGIDFAADYLKAVLRFRIDYAGKVKDQMVSYCATNDCSAVTCPAVDCANL